MRKYAIELTEREIMLLNSWLNTLKEERPNYYNKYTETVFNIFENKANKIVEATREKYDKIKFQREYECNWIEEDVHYE